MSDSKNDLADFSMLELFRVEAETQIGVLTQGLLQVEHGAEQYQLEELMRAAHSIKGAARMVDILPVVTVAHAMEDCFVAAQEGKLSLQVQHVDHFLHCLDLIQQIAALNEGGLSDWLKNNQVKIDENVKQSRAYLEVASVADSSGDFSPDQSPDQFKEQSFDSAVPSPQAVEKVEVEPPVSRSELKQISGAINSAVFQPNAAIAQTPVIDFADQDPAVQKVKKKHAVAEKSSSEIAACNTNGPSCDLSIKVSSLCFDKLLGIAGESLVESRRLAPYTRSVARLKQQQGKLIVKLDRIREKMLEQDASPELIAMLREVQENSSEYRGDLAGRVEELEQIDRRSSRIAENLHREVISSRMRPFSEGVTGIQRTLRDIARDLGKQIKLDIQGLKTPVDREVLERIKSPLDHILRNAVDHGLELPAEREKAGKPENGTIELSAFHSAGMLSIIVKDDGRGIHLESLRSRIVARGLTNELMASTLSEAELLEFLYLPGFSTRDTVTEMSGRGVGMDTVMTVIKEMNGVVHMRNWPGHGFQLHIQLPLSLSVIRALLVEIEGEAYAFPLSRIERIEKIDSSELKALSGQPYFVAENRNISLISASQILELGNTNCNSELLSVVVIGDHNGLYGVIVDRFIGERELAVQKLDSRLGKVKDIAAAATLDDGRMSLIFDVEDMLHSIAKIFGAEVVYIDSVRSRENINKKLVKRILIVDDSMTVREVERKLLLQCGYEVDVAVDGLDAWNTLRKNSYELVITDVDMPRMNGIELVEKIKAESRYCGLPVVIVSYKDRDDDRERGLLAGADYYLTKGSFHDDTLRNAVVDLIGEVAA
ncbi:MAG: hybrid sensor histidine kinase/response regulator [Gammaproteobacteria bacterium]|nr:hybrid sensor histidine kinase/response regulator [Gammaproteobacteria bacterium]